MKKPSSSYKKKYAIAKHHAWAGSVLLAILLALRIFYETNEKQINDTIFLGSGIIIVFYILIALFLTYRYQSGLSSDDSIATPSSHSDEIEKEKIQSDLEKERLKLEKKKAKSEAKALKKQNKAKEKESKKNNEKNL
jgi:purine-cytosine permease-like protein